MTIKRIIQGGCFAAMLVPVLALAQQAEQKRRVYCWDEGGRRICGDALPTSAVDAARTEISADTGRVKSRVGRTLTPEEQAEADAEAARAVADAEAQAAARRRDMAMVESYATEADLERAYDNRIILVDESIRTSQMGMANLRMSLLTQLRQAAEAELKGQPVQAPLRDNIARQHADLLRQQAILEQQLQEREALDASLREARERYRDLTAAREQG